MEHPYLFFVKICEMIGLGHFAHAYPHVIYSWVVMTVLIVLSAIAAKGISMIPTKAQNFFEIAISGMEEFMVDITGEEGRWFFSVDCHSVSLHCRMQPFRTHPWFFPTHGQHQHNAFLRFNRGNLYPHHWYQIPRA